MYPHFTNHKLVDFVRCEFIDLSIRSSINRLNATNLNYAISRQFARTHTFSYSWNHSWMNNNNSNYSLLALFIFILWTPFYCFRLNFIISWKRVREKETAAVNIYWIQKNSLDNEISLEILTVQSRFQEKSVFDSNKRSFFINLVWLFLPSECYGFFFEVSAVLQIQHFQMIWFFSNAVILVLQTLWFYFKIIAKKSVKWWELPHEIAEKNR